MLRYIFSTLMGVSVCLLIMLPQANAQSAICEELSAGVPFGVRCSGTFSIQSDRELREYLRETNKGNYFSGNVVGSVTWEGELTIATPCDFTVSRGAELRAVISAKGRNTSPGQMQVIANNIANQGTVSGDSLEVCANGDLTLSPEGTFEVSPIDALQVTNTLNGSRTMELNGIVYMPNQDVDFSGGSTSSTGSIEVGSMTMASQSDLNLSGSVDLADFGTFKSTGNTYLSGFAIHSQGKVEFNNQNHFEDGVIVSTPQVSLNTEEDVNITGGTLEADNVTIDAGRSMVISVGTYSVGNSIDVRTEGPVRFQDVRIEGRTDDNGEVAKPVTTLSAGGDANATDVRISGRSLAMEAPSGLINCIRCNFNGENFKASSAEAEYEGGQIIATGSISFAAENDNLTIKNSQHSALEILIVVAKDFLTEGNIFRADQCNVEVGGQIIGDFTCEPRGPEAPSDVKAEAIGGGAVRINWIPPTPNSPNTQWAGFRIYYGNVSGDYGQSQIVQDPQATEAIVSNLQAGTWYFAMTTISEDGTESGYSEEAATEVR